MQASIPYTLVGVLIDGLTYSHGVLQLSREYDHQTRTSTYVKYGTDIKHSDSGPAVINHETGCKEWWLNGEMVDCSDWQELTRFIEMHNRKFCILH